MAKFTKSEYNNNGTWTCPAGVTQILVWGYGGGSSGSAGNRDGWGYGGIGGCATTPRLLWINVVPNTTYSITIGGGGVPASGSSGSSRNAGRDGGDTLFGSLVKFVGASGIPGIDFSTNKREYYNVEGLSEKFSFNQQQQVYSPNNGQGASSGIIPSGVTFPFQSNDEDGFPGATNLGNAGNGGSFPANAGQSAAVNSGSGGGGGAQANSGNGGNSGAGGSGKLVILWVE